MNSKCLCFLFSLGLLLQSFCALGQTEDRLDSLLSGLIEKKGPRPVHGLVATIHKDSSNWVYRVGLGQSKSSHQPVTWNDQFNAASITKLFVATVVLQLMEEGQLDLDTQVATFLRDVDYLRFDEFHQIDGHGFSEEITIRHLLQHTSGIGDFFIDRAFRFNLSVFFHRQRQYTPEKIVDRYFKYRVHRDAHFRPGEGYFYSDTNYLLLGLIIEQITEQELPAAIRERILVPLEMSNTYFLFYEDATGHGPVLDSYIGRFKMTNVNTSYEWGGGSHLTTTEDLAKFLKGLFALKLFQKKGTLAQMITTSAQSKHRYGLGIYRYSINGHTYYGHGGFYGTLAMHCPELATTFVAHIGQANPSFNSHAVTEKILEIVHQPVADEQ